MSDSLTDRTIGFQLDVKIMRCIRNIAIILVSFNVVATYASEELDIGTVKIVTGDWPPYYGSLLPDGGPVAMNIMLACKEAKFDCNIDFLSWNRVWYTLEAGEADMAFAYAKTEERLEKYAYSRAAIHYFSESVFFLKSKFPNGIDFAEYKDLVGYTMLGHDPSWYAEGFKTSGVNTTWMLSTADKWKMLLLGRADALLSDVYQGLYELRQQEQASDAFKGHIGFTERSYTAESNVPDYIIFSKPHFDKRRQLIRDSLDQALMRMDVAATVASTLDDQYSGDAHEVQ